LKQSTAPEINTTAPTLSRRSASLSFWPLVAATFFMVSGGTYGTEDIVRGAGYSRAIWVLLLTPVVWSLPTTLMIGELAAAMPSEGGFYAWVRRAMGNFWGFQEAWLSLVASIFDMAIYPTLFVTYLARLVPWFGEGHRGIVVGAVMIASCALLNIAGVYAVAETSLGLFILLSAPFAVMTIVAPFRHGALLHTAAPLNAPEVGFIGGMLVCMWNYMGWDNASTVAVEVRDPQRTYPRAMMAAVAIVALSYVLPVAAVRFTGASPAMFTTGSWADLGGLLAGPWLRTYIVIAAMCSAFGMFNALVMSYSRLPLAMALDGMMPRVFSRLSARTRAPWVSIIVLATAWAACLGIGFERLVTLDILIYGASLMLEFAALVVLRVREPEMPRPFRVPGGLGGAIALGVCPALLLGFAVVRSEAERVAGMSSFIFGLLLIVAGFVAYWLGGLWRARSQASRTSTAAGSGAFVEANSISSISPSGSEK
jgi:amino acid transporter